MPSYNDGWDSDGLPRGFVYYPWVSDEEEDDRSYYSSDGRWTSSDESEEEYHFSEPEEDYSDEEWSEEDESDEDESDEEVPKRTARKRRPKAPSPSPEVRRRFGKDLSLLPKMPLDILFEIFSRLEPKDLVNLLRVNKMFRSTLLRPNAQFVWAASRTRRRVPAPSRGFTEAAWAIFLFGTKCELCGSMQVNKVDWFLRRRACGRCKRVHLQDGRKFAAKFPQYDITILQYIPYWEMPDRNYSTNDVGKNKFFWADDIHVAGKKWASFQKACLRGEPGAEVAFELWKEERKAVLEAAKEDAQEFKDTLPAKAMRVKRKRDRIRERFIPLGYSKVDIDRGVDDCVQEYYGTYRGRIPKLRDADWMEFRKKCEPYIKEAQKYRLERELKAAKEERMELFRSCCEQFLSTMRPSERQHCPPVEVFRALPEISSLVDAPLGTSVKAEDFQPFVANLATHISNYKTRQREEALATLPAEYRSMADPFELARFILRCDMHLQYQEIDWNEVCSKFMVTWPMVTSHTCEAWTRFFYEQAPGPESLPKIALHERASARAVELITMSGLDPDTATVRDMDERGALFVCNRCPSQTVTVHTWRTAVFHPDAWNQSKCQGECLARGDNPVRFRLANEMETKHAREISRDGAPVWSCDHCTMHLRPIDATSKSDVGHHLKNIHGIVDPKEGVDFFLNEACRFILHSAFAYEDVPKVSPFRCIHPKCAKSPNRSFSEHGLRLHIGCIHGVGEPVLDVDYIVVHPMPLPPEVVNWKMKMKTITLTGVATNDERN
ncbi:hypothetical protein DFP72DRAFT_908530 [Ephemerocybe angulata]|uniref:F-box domain-containing protein n=1 Tax=Ephemerocybe angulata TaxID=980116 RepID=A0A8H6HRP6_9AGAR|nr:hypothetical protein DFP72DRAFT_908530 [Tulosesus angulatus]